MGMREEMNKIASELRLRAIIIESVSWEAVPLDNAMTRLRDIRLGVQKQTDAMRHIEQTLKAVEELS